MLALCMISMAVSADIRLMDKVESQPAASEFALPDIDGMIRRLSDYKGKYLLVNFWAVWCQPCREEMPAMNVLNDKLKSEDFDMVAIHVGPAEPGIDKFMQEIPVDFTILVDADISLTEWNVIGLPTTFLIDPEGRIIYRALSLREWDAPEMIRFLDTILAGKPG